MLIGRHVSLNQYRHDLDIDAIQVFTKPPQQYFATNKAVPLEFGSLYVCAHAGYLIHLKHGARSQSAAALLHEAERCAIIGIPDLVCHFSSAKLSIQKECIESIAHRWPETVRLLIENNCRDSYHQTWLLAESLKGIIPIGTCFDTCHGFAAGDNWDCIAGADLIHVNDSVYSFGSKRDRHASLGRGFINVDDLVVALKKATVPLILETPDGPQVKEELTFLRKELV